MQDLFNTIGQQIYKQNNHYGYIVKWNVISPICKKWSRNRDPDYERVQEMIDHYNHGGYLPRIIHLAELSSEEGLVCYDGNHRREVFNACQDDSDTIVDVIFNAEQKDIYIAFNNINKSIQVPAIYFDETNSSVRTEILALVKNFEYKYKAFLSTSARCHAPHFNRDSFVDNIYDIYQSYSGKYTVKQIEHFLYKLNEEYANGRLCKPHQCYSPKVIEKCRSYHFWLFIDKRIPIQHIQHITNVSI